MEKVVNKKFIFLVIFVFSFLVFEVIYLKSRDDFLDERLEFVKLTKTNSFAFYNETPYLRHQFAYEINDIFSFHPGFRESKIGTFISSGYHKRFIKDENLNGKKE